MHYSSISKLFLRLRHRIVILRLIEIRSHRLPQLVLIREILRREIAPIRIPIRNKPLIKTQFKRLLINQKHVTMQTGTTWRRRTHIFRQRLSFFNARSGDVHHQPVVPLSSARVFTAWRVRIRHYQRVVTVWICGELNLWFLTHLRWRQFVAEFGFDAGWPSCVKELFWGGGYHVGDDLFCF